MARNYYVYILASRRNGTLYIGVTNNLDRRVFEHKNKLAEGFTSEHSVDRLVYYEHTTDINAALQREKHLKAWKRAWKIKLIESQNPTWSDMSPSLNVPTKIGDSGSLPSQG